MVRLRSLSLIFVGIGQLYLVVPNDLEGVEIYRFGSAGDQLAETPDIRFHHIPWSNFAEKDGLDEEALAAGVLQPRFLSLDENIARTSIERGGGPYVPGNVGYYLTAAAHTMVDADPSSAYEWVTTAVSNNYSTTAFIQQRVLSLDLGGLFHISRVRLFTSESGHYPDRLDIAAIGDLELRARAGFHNDHIVFRVRENVADTIDVSFPSTPARNVGLRLYRISPKAVKVAEVEVYGEGYITQGTYVGPFIELDEPAI